MTLSGALCEPLIVLQATLSTAGCSRPQQRALWRWRQNGEICELIGVA